MAVYYNVRPIPSIVKVILDPSKGRFSNNTAANLLDASDSVISLVGGSIINSGSGTFDFDGTNSMPVANSTNTNSVDNVTDLTHCMWVRCINTGSSEAQMIWEEGGTANGLNLYIYSGSLVGGIWSENDSWAGQWVSQSHAGERGDLELGRWYHVCVGLVGAGSTLTTDAGKFYVDGELITTFDATWLSSHTGDIEMGAPGGTGPWQPNTDIGTADGWNLSGSIGVVVRTNEDSLTDLQVRQIYESQRSRYPL